MPRPDDNPAIGQYDTTRAESATRPRVPDCIIAKDKMKDVNSNTAQGYDDPNVGPGAYTTDKPFGSDVKPFTIA